ncbi:hypothetical protein BU23DRAFT_521907 [Bimuria novae-zelandiae CBS 107.79]|uniref:Rhodopsin domain-containing protein n=1 Tax=Bimuria novae-zelandiae CBS 107.79 TaxID=1447943 RepID=A0A6A5VTF6_9PLEO|nr:hypothetical protein BU23DRAFT_521907 [Bimuria novae-zelandiae CBS 107.79]
MASHDPEHLSKRGQRLQNVAIAHLALSWIFIALRTWTRGYINPNFGWDDGTIIFAGFIFTSYCACIFYIERNGGGTHVTDLTQLHNLTKRAVASQASYIATVMMLKISVAIFFARIVVKRWHFTVIYATVTISCVSATAAFFYCLFRCGANLDLYVLRQMGNLCTPRGLDRFFAYQHAAFAFFTDCVFVLLPIPVLWNTNMSRRSKFSVGFILSLAALGCVCSAIRFRYVDGLTQIEDFFWNATNISVWSTIEAGAGIISACMTTLRPLVKHFSMRVRSLRPSGIVSTIGSLPIEYDSMSSNRKRGRDEQLYEFQTHRGHRLSTEIQHREVIPVRTSYGTSRGSAECILSQGESLYLASMDTKASRIHKSGDRTLRPVETSVESE